IQGALEEALASDTPEGRLPLVLFLTDGAPTVGETRPDVIVQRAADLRRQRRLFTFGIGADVNAALLEQLALQGRGTATFVRPEESVERAVGVDRSSRASGGDGRAYSRRRCTTLRTGTTGCGRSVRGTGSRRARPLLRNAGGRYAGDRRPEQRRTGALDGSRFLSGARHGERVRRAALGGATRGLPERGAPSHRRQRRTRRGASPARRALRHPDRAHVIPCDGAWRAVGDGNARSGRHPETGAASETGRELCQRAGGRAIRCRESRVRTARGQVTRRTR